MFYYETKRPPGAGGMPNWLRTPGRPSSSVCVNKHVNSVIQYMHKHRTDDSIHTTYIIGESLTRSRRSSCAHSLLLIVAHCIQPVSVLASRHYGHAIGTRQLLHHNFKLSIRTWLLPWCTARGVPPSLAASKTASRVGVIVPWMMTNVSCLAPWRGTSPSVAAHPRALLSLEKCGMVARSGFICTRGAYTTLFLRWGRSGK